MEAKFNFFNTFIFEQEARFNCKCQILYYLECKESAELFCIAWIFKYSILTLPSSNKDLHVVILCSIQQIFISYALDKALLSIRYKNCMHVFLSLLSITYTIIYNLYLYYSLFSITKKIVPDDKFNNLC